MVYSFNVGDIFYVKERDDIIPLECVADDPEERNCPLCFFYGCTLLCQTISCRGRHFVPIERKEAQQ